MQPNMEVEAVVEECEYELLGRVGDPGAERGEMDYPYNLEKQRTGRRRTYGRSVKGGWAWEGWQGSIKSQKKIKKILSARAIQASLKLSV